MKPIPTAKLPSGERVPALGQGTWNMGEDRSVILIALLAVVRKLLILDVATTEALQLFALAAAIRTRRAPAAHAGTAVAGY